MGFLRNVYITLFRAYTLRDTSLFESEPKDIPAIYGMYHVFCDSGWQNLVIAQIKHLKASGLLNVTRILYVSCVYRDNKDVDELRGTINSDKVRIVAANKNPKVFEYPALKFIYEKSSTENCLFYYFHTKGVSYHYDKPNSRRYKHYMHNLEAWRLMMEYFVMDKWNVAVNVLLFAGYDNYGCYRYPPAPVQTMYAGNFWWTKSSYIRALPAINIDETGRDRMSAETWIRSAKGKDYCPFDTLALLSRVYMPASLYTDTHPSLADRIRFVARFNFTKIVKKLFKYNYDKHTQHKYQKI